MEEKSRFSLGRIVVTPDAKQRVTEERIQDALERHARSDWDELDAWRRAANEEALREGRCISSSLVLADESTLWVTTNGSRTETLVMTDDDRFAEIAVERWEFELREFRLAFQRLHREAMRLCKTTGATDQFSEQAQALDAMASEIYALTTYGRPNLFVRLGWRLQHALRAWLRR